MITYRYAYKETHTSIYAPHLHNNRFIIIITYCLHERKHIFLFTYLVT